jgi:hypothetical protein
MQLSELFSEVRQISVGTKLGEVTVNYRPASYTAEVEALLLNAGQHPLSTLCRILGNLLVEWDVMDGEKMYPISEEALMRLPAQFLLTIMQAITEDMRPNPLNQLA